VDQREDLYPAAPAGGQVVMHRSAVWARLDGVISERV